MNDRQIISRLCYICKIGHLENATALLDENPFYINQRDQDGKNSLHYAAEKGHLEVVKILLTFDHNLINGTDALGRTAIFFAVQ